MATDSCCLLSYVMCIRCIHASGFSRVGPVRLRRANHRRVFEKTDEDKISADIFNGRAIRPSVRAFTPRKSAAHGAGYLTAQVGAPLVRALFGDRHLGAEDPDVCRPGAGVNGP